MDQAKTTSTIASAITDYLKFVKLTRSENTALTYSKALKEFKKILFKAKIDPEKSYPTQLDGGSGKQTMNWTRAIMKSSKEKHNVDPQNSALPGVYAINKSQLMIKIA